MTKISQLSAIGANLAPDDQMFVRDISDSGTPMKSVTPADVLQVCSQGAPAAINTTSALTASTLKSSIITTTTAAAVDLTLPSGADMDASYTSPYSNLSLDWYVVNTGPNTATILAATGHTIVGSASVTTNTSGHFRSRRTAANTYVTYRLS